MTVYKSKQTHVRRGETPVFTFKFKFDLSEFDKMSLAFSQKGEVVLEKTLDDVTVEGNIVKLKLSETDTLSFVSNELCEFQFRFGIGDDDRFESDIFVIDIDRILRDGPL